MMSNTHTNGRRLKVEESMMAAVVKEAAVQQYIRDHALLVRHFRDHTHTAGCAYCASKEYAGRERSQV